MDSVFVYKNPETTAPGTGPLQGLKITVQPNISVKGWPADAGSKAAADFKALEDATVIERLRQAGASICGSIRMSEFGFGLYNSSAGNALKQKSADAELVMDMTGECRLAALQAGVCGFKPSYGIVSRYGLIGLIPSMEGCGILAEKPESIMNMMKAAAGQDGKDFSLTGERLPDFSPIEIVPGAVTFGTIKEAKDALTTGQKQSFQTSLDELKKAGFPIKEVSMPEFSLFSLIHNVVGSVEASSAAGRYDSVRYGHRAPGAKNWNEMYLNSRSEAFGLLVKSFLFQGAYFQFDRYEAFENACRIRARLVKELQQVLAQVDYLIAPALPYTSSEEPLLNEMYRHFDTTLFANVAGLPALCLPEAGSSRSGFQIAGPRLSDAHLLSLGMYLMNNRRGGR